MFRHVISLLILAALAGLLVWTFRAQRSALDAHQRKQEDVAAAQAAQVQANCAQAAQDRFVRLGLDAAAGGTYKGHFNTARNQCYQLIGSRRSAAGTDWKTFTLYDASGKVFGNYGWHSDSSGRAASPPYTCDVTLPSGAQQTCASETEFRQLIGAYLQ
ncbi:MAG: hypothetical protein JSS41_10710 [Proteobacteria bacterium]|nr:hypothetical protein [Pseudomonadota bacterium]